MKKIAVVGSSGAGKSTFARKLDLILKIKVFHLDRLFWKQNWTRKTHYDRIALLEKLTLGEKQWIIEGNYLASLEPVLQEAEAIIFLDISPFLCLFRIIKRHYTYHQLYRRDIPSRSTDKLTLSLMIQVLIFSFQGHRRIEQTLLRYPSKRIIRLRSVEEVEDFLALQKQIMRSPGDLANLTPAQKAQILSIEQYSESGTLVTSKT